MSRNEYQNKVGPRWFVIEVKEDPDTRKRIPNFTTNIKVNDDITFEGDGGGGPGCNVWNHRTKAAWGTNCNFTSPGTITLVHNPGTPYSFQATYIPGTPDKVKVEQTSGQNSWTAQEGG